MSDDEDKRPLSVEVIPVPVLADAGTPKKGVALKFQVPPDKKDEPHLQDYLKTLVQEATGIPVERQILYKRHVDDWSGDRKVWFVEELVVRLLVTDAPVPSSSGASEESVDSAAILLDPWLAAVRKLALPKVAELETSLAASDAKRKYNWRSRHRGRVPPVCVAQVTRLLDVVKADWIFFCEVMEKKGWKAYACRTPAPRIPPMPFSVDDDRDQFGDTLLRQYQRFARDIMYPHVAQAKRAAQAEVEGIRASKRQGGNHTRPNSWYQEEPDGLYEAPEFHPSLFARARAAAAASHALDEAMTDSLLPSSLVWVHPTRQLVVDGSPLLHTFHEAIGSAATWEEVYLLEKTDGAHKQKSHYVRYSRPEPRHTYFCSLVDLQDEEKLPTAAHRHALELMWMTDAVNSPSLRPPPKNSITPCGFPCCGDVERAAHLAYRQRQSWLGHGTATSSHGDVPNPEEHKEASQSNSFMHSLHTSCGLRPVGSLELAMELCDDCAPLSVTIWKMHGRLSNRKGSVIRAQTLEQDTLTFLDLAIRQKAYNQAEKLLGRPSAEVSQLMAARGNVISKFDSHGMQHDILTGMSALHRLCDGVIDELPTPLLQLLLEAKADPACEVKSETTEYSGKGYGGTSTIKGMTPLYLYLGKPSGRPNRRYTASRLPRNVEQVVALGRNGGLNAVVTLEQEEDDYSEEEVEKGDAPATVGELWARSWAHGDGSPSSDAALDSGLTLFEHVFVECDGVCHLPKKNISALKQLAPEDVWALTAPQAKKPPCWSEVVLIQRAFANVVATRMQLHLVAPVLPALHRLFSRFGPDVRDHLWSFLVLKPYVSRWFTHGNAHTNKARRKAMQLCVLAGPDVDVQKLRPAGEIIDEDEY